MCIPNFNDFIAENPKYKKFTSSVNAQNIYSYLSTPESIEKMVSANDNGRPALYGVQAYLESNFAGYPDFDFNEGFVKQCVGSMIRTIIEPLGFKPLLQRDLPKKDSLYFTSAMHYSFEEKTAKCRLVKKLEIEAVNNQ